MLCSLPFPLPFIRFGIFADQPARGLLYMNPLSYFRSLDHPARNDPHEAEDSIIQPSDIGEFIIDPERQDFEKIRVTPTDLAGPVRIALHQTLRCHVFWD